MLMVSEPKFLTKINTGYPRHPTTFGSRGLMDGRKPLSEQFRTASSEEEGV